VLLNRDAKLGLINRSGTGKIGQINATPLRNGVGLTLSEANRAAAVTTGYASSIFFFQQTGELIEPILIERANSAIWRPTANIIATRYYPDEILYGSNTVALFALESDGYRLIETYDLKRLAITDVFDWSSSGNVIALSQYDRLGSVIYYLFVEDGEAKRSLFYTNDRTCVLDAQWSPADEVLAFSAENSATEGQDIFLERVPSDNRREWSLVNVTQSPGQDERNVTWSPNGTRIAFVKAFEDEKGVFRQELFMVNVGGESLEQVEVTDTENQFETDPMWISDSEIAFLSWDNEQSTWSLNKVSIANNEIEQIMQIPESWYEKF
jgi:Tol biopolymer transport system component